MNIPDLSRIFSVPLGKKTSLTLRTFSVMVLTAVLLGIWIISREGKKKGYPSELLSDLMFWVLLGGIIGARLLYVFTHLSWYMSHPQFIPAIWEGGISLHGAILGGMISFLLYCRAKKLSPWELGDIFTLPIPLGAAIGRIGCFVNPYDDFGNLCSPHEFPSFLSPLLCMHFYWDPEGVYRLPWPLIDGLVQLLNFFLLIWLYRKKILGTGEYFFFYIILHSFERFILEIWRNENMGGSSYTVLGNITLFQMSAPFIILTCLAVVVIRHFLLQSAQLAKKK